MATKAIYTQVDGKYYRVNQDTTNPTETVKMPRTHSQMSTDQAAKVVNTTIWVNTLDSEYVKSNKELYDEMIDHIEHEDIIEIPTIENHFVLYCDYSIFNENGEEVSHSAFTKKLKSKDAIFNLGVNEESELVYKQVKVFNSDIALNVRNEYPMGIMRNSSKVKYTLLINDISIFQDLVYTDSDEHKSTDKNSYPISSVLETMVRVYSTHDNGLVISAVEIPFVPKKIVIDINITLDDIIVVYDNQDVLNAIHKNYGDITGDGGDSSDEEDDEDVQIIILNGGTSVQ
jgi:hypothetical protein